MHAFTTLATELRDRLYRLALRLTGDGGAAEDVVQEVLVSGWQREGGLDGLDSPAAYLLKQTYRRAIDHLRARRVRLNNEAAAARADISVATPHRHVESADTLNHIHRLMQGLPPDQRSVLHLREVEGMSYQEISEATSLSLPQVKTYLHRGRQRLRTLLLEEKIVER